LVADRIGNLQGKPRDSAHTLNWIASRCDTAFHFWLLGFSVGAIGQI
jgi:alpha/beta superfamily hydrolase